MLTPHHVAYSTSAFACELAKDHACTLLERDLREQVIKIGIASAPPLSI